VLKLFKNMRTKGYATCLTVGPEISDTRPGRVTVQTILGGICASDLSLINMRVEGYYGLGTRMLPEHIMTLGHENVARIVSIGPEVPPHIKPGQRVCVMPMMSCASKDFEKKEWCKFCKQNQENGCLRVADQSAHWTNCGLCIGIGDHGGSWSDRFPAHYSQLSLVPDSVSDENAVLVEPLAVTIHAVLSAFPRDEDTVLVYGAGIIGLLTIAALRGLGSKAKILAIARYDFQVQACKKLGADVILRSGHLEADMAAASGSKLLHSKFAALGIRPVVVGGCSVIYDCVASRETMENALNWAGFNGRVVMVGIPNGRPHLMASFTRSVTIIPSTIYNNSEEWRGKKWRVFDLALHLMTNGLDISWCLTHKFPLADFEKAMDIVQGKSKTPVIKAAFYP